MPLYMNRQYAYPIVSAAGGRGNIATDYRLHPQLAPGQNPYQDWTTAGISLMPETPVISVQPTNVPSPAAAASLAVALSDSGTPRMGDMTPTLLVPNDIATEGPKDEWTSSSRAESSISLGSKYASVLDLNEYERGRPQIRVPGQGEDSLFDGVSVVPHNPHVMNRID